MQLSFTFSLKGGESQTSQEVQWDGWSARLRAVGSQSAAQDWIHTLAERCPMLIPEQQFCLMTASWL